MLQRQIWNLTKFYQFLAKFNLSKNLPLFKIYNVSTVKSKGNALPVGEKQEGSGSTKLSTCQSLLPQALVSGVSSVKLKGHLYQNKTYWRFSDITKLAGQFVVYYGLRHTALLSKMQTRCKPRAVCKCFKCTYAHILPIKISIFNIYKFIYKLILSLKDHEN